jgi:hypothetical protein
MTMWKKFGAGLALTAGMTPALWAQIPGVPAPAVPGVPGVAVPAAPVSPANIWSFLCMTPDQKLACKLKLCNSPLGKLLNNGMGPMGAFSGGMFGPFCPPVDPADLAKPATSAEGAAARIKASEADAKARRAAVRYLGTVDCKRWPEAQDALKNALRADTNECVRWEAAMALGSGCCCTPETIIALTLTVSGSKEDGNPEERSERVKAAAYFSLEHCLSCVPVAPKAPPPIPTPEPPARPLPERTPNGAAAAAAASADSTPAIATAAYYQRARKLSVADAAFYARQALARTSYEEQGAPLTKKEGPGLLNIVAKAMTGGRREMTVASPEPMLATTEPAAVEHPSPIPVRTVSHPAQEEAVTPPAKTVSRPVEAAPVVQEEPQRKTLMRVIEQRRSAKSGTVIETQAPQAPSRPAVLVQPPRATTPAAPIHTASGVQPPRTAAPVEPARLAISAEPVRTPTAAEPTMADRALFALRELESPKQRASAAAYLGREECKSNTLVVPGLLTAALNDRDTSVRVEAIRSLSRLQVNSALVRRTLESLKSDYDPLVREEAMRTMNMMPAHTSNAVQTPGVTTLSGQ